VTIKHDYYTEINKALISYEQYKPYHTHKIEWITNRIDWCWRWRKITEEQMNELVDRVIAVMEQQKYA